MHTRIADRNFRQRLVTLLAVVVAAPVTAMAAGRAYRVTDLGTLGGPTSTASGVNNNGSVVGTSTVTSRDSIHAFQWQNGISDLGAVPPTPQSMGFAINDGGQVVGVSYALGETGGSAVRWDKGLPTVLGTFVARDINNAGVVVGVAQESVGGGFLSSQAVRWENSAVTYLGTLGGDASVAQAVNANGWIVGGSPTAAGAQPHAFVWVAKSLHDLGTLGGSYSFAYDVNDDGHVVGIAATASGQRHAFRFDVTPAGQVTSRVDLGELGGGYGAAYAINESDQIVGTSDDRAFLYEQGAMSDLNTLISPSSGWELKRATDINDGGAIVGEGRIGGRVRAFLLTPFLLGDTNCDGAVDAEDVDPFFLALGHPTVYLTSFPNCDLSTADVNRDGAVDAEDIDPFFICLAAGGCP